LIAAGFLVKLLRDAGNISEADVWDASPVRVDWPPQRYAIEPLRALHHPDETLFAGGTYDSTLKNSSVRIADFENGAPAPPHIIPNSLSGRVGLTKDDKKSFRADACVTRFRFSVAEFAALSRDNQIRFSCAVNLHVCVLIDSGGNSLHA
jgi:hypothetical protein